MLRASLWQQDSGNEGSFDAERQHSAGNWVWVTHSCPRLRPRHNADHLYYLAYSLCGCLCSGRIQGDASVTASSFLLSGCGRTFSGKRLRRTVGHVSDRGRAGVSGVVTQPL